jgi:hypothetical protein
MKIINGLNPLPETRPTQATQTPRGAASFETLLGQCQASGGATPDNFTVKLTTSVLNLLDRIATQLGDGSSARDLVTSHEQLSRQAAELRQAAESMQPGALKTIASETATLSYLQLLKFEQGQVL